MNKSKIQEQHDEQAAYERGDAGLPDVCWDDMFYKAHKDRGELLGALKEADNLCNAAIQSAVFNEEQRVKAEAALRESEKQMKRANDMINNSYQCECGNPKTPCPCLEDFLDNIQAILAGV